MLICACDPAILGKKVCKHNIIFRTIKRHLIIKYPVLILILKYPISSRLLLLPDLHLLWLFVRCNFCTQTCMLTALKTIQSKHFKTQESFQIQPTKCSHELTEKELSLTYFNSISAAEYHMQCKKNGAEDWPNYVIWRHKSERGCDDRSNIAAQLLARFLRS